MVVPKIKHVVGTENHTLIVAFDNGETKQYDVGKLFENSMFSPLKDPAFFKNVRVEPGGYAVYWNENIDISEYELWKNGIPHLSV